MKQFMAAAAILAITAATVFAQMGGDGMMGGGSGQQGSITE